MALLQARGIDCLFRLTERDRHTKWKKRSDKKVLWKRPSRPKWMSQEEYADYPEALRFREIKTGDVILVTTLTNTTIYKAKAIKNLYKRRYEVELDLRNIKDIMQMDILRCKTPSMVKKEIWMHLIGYNLVRGLIAESCRLCANRPERISFKSALQTIRSFQASFYASKQNNNDVYRTLLFLIGRRMIVVRPNRMEPRAVKRRKKCLALLTSPRLAARRNTLDAIKKAA